MKHILHVEVLQRADCTVNRETLQDLIHGYLKGFVTLIPGSELKNSDLEEYSNLRKYVESIRFCDTGQSVDNLDVSSTNIVYHIYTLDMFDGEMDYNIAGEDEGDELPAAKVWPLPSKDFYNLWESLVFDTNIKEDVLNFVETSLLFSDRNVDPSIINCNRVVLLHGPPGTGKTSLCKALAQKLSIRLGKRYERAHLFEVNSHSLFSKWFSESGKLVLKLFTKIKEYAEDSQALICILIDEVESLTHARKAALSGTEPSDSIRVVNAVLTQIDQMKKYTNVLILTTSNMTGAIDLAFVDRADIKQFVGLPSTTAIYAIYYSCLKELIKAGIIYPQDELFTHHILEMSGFNKNEVSANSLELLNIAKFSIGLSGRSLRKIPFLAHALFLNKPTVKITEFLQAMKSAVMRHVADSEKFTTNFDGLNLKD